MNLDEKILAVEKIFSVIDVATDNVKKTTGLSCARGCGKCCSNPAIESTVLEMMPMAQNILESGDVEAVLSAAALHDKGICVFFEASVPDGSSGKCLAYDKRPSLCRMFGFAGRRNKFGANEFSYCAVHKRDIPDAVSNAEKLAAAHKVEVPLFTFYTQQIENLDPDLGHQRYGINKSLLLAMENLLMRKTYLTPVSS